MTAFTALAVVAGTAIVAGTANSIFNKPSQPAAPDYAGAATAQGQANIDAARLSAKLGNPNIISPYGNQTVTFGGTPTFDQSGYDAAMSAYQNQQGNSYQNSGFDEFGNPVSGYNAPMPTREQFTSVSNSDQPTITQTLTPAAQEALTNAQAVQKGLSQVGITALGNVQDTMGKPFVSNTPEFQTSIGDQGPVNYGPAADQYGLAGSVSADKYGLAQGFSAEKYGNAQGTLDLSGVAKMPINAGMTAQQAIMSRLGPQIEAQRASTFQSLRNQGVTEGSEAWNNAIRSQQQGENDLMTQAQLQGLNLDMSANQQGYGQQLSSAGLYNQALGQNFSQGLQANQASNQAIGQNYGQGITSQNQSNAAIGQNFGQGLQSAGLYNQAQNQKYNQALQSAQFGNTALGQQYQRNLSEYNLPLNTLTALQSGSQIQNPQFQAYTGQTIAPAPIANATTLAGNYAQNQYGQNVAANNATTQGLFSIAGSAMGGAAGLYGKMATPAPAPPAAP